MTATTGTRRAARRTGPATSRASRRFIPDFVARRGGTPWSVWLGVVVGALCVFGTVMVFGASSVASIDEGGDPFHYVARHVLFLTGGAVLYLIASRVDYRRLRGIGAVGLGIAILMCGAVLTSLGVYSGGARRWLDFGVTTFQPSEAIKLPLAIVLAAFLAKREQAGELSSLRRTLVPIALVTGFIALLIMKEPDFDSTLVIIGLVAGVMFVAAVPGRWLLGSAVAGAGLVAYALSQPFRRERLLIFMDPWRDPLDAGYQSIAASTSMAIGGWFGTGLGSSTAKWGFLPVAYSDFIFAVIGEETGVVGCVFVIACFAAFGWLGLQIARRAPDRFGQLLAVGLTLTVLLQAMINIGMVVGIVPVSGLTLPFLSYGGSSLVLMLLAAGILANIARQAKPSRAR
ncbi:MAG: putative lipid II flippase FtsW [Actinomycetes bacterium]